jgi:predicted alpha/beta hydrolase
VQTRPEIAQEFVERGEDRIALQIYPQPPEPSAPQVIIWPAMGVPARYYRPFATQLAAAGLAVVVADLRGTGASTPRPSRRSRYDYGDLADDVGAVLDHLAPRGRRTVLMGHSLGGQMCALYLARTENRSVDGLALVAVGLPWFRSYSPRRARGVLALTQWINALSSVLGVWPGWGFGGRQARGVMRDWAYTARHGRFPTSVAPAGLSSVRLPVLAVSLDGDSYTPAPTLDHLCSLMPDAKVQRVHLGPAELGTVVDHLSWARASTPIAGLVTGFVTGEQK